MCGPVYYMHLLSHICVVLCTGSELYRTLPKVLSIIHVSVIIGVDNNDNHKNFPKLYNLRESGWSDSAQLFCDYMVSTSNILVTW